SDDSASKEEAPAAKEEKKEAPAEKPAAKEESTDSSADSANDDVVASPAARKLAREKNIDLSKVKAQDPLDRIRTEDVEEQVKHQHQVNQLVLVKKTVRLNKNSQSRQDVRKCPVAVKQSQHVWWK